MKPGDRITVLHKRCFDAMVERYRQSLASGSESILSMMFPADKAVALYEDELKTSSAPWLKAIIAYLDEQATTAPQPDASDPASSEQS